MKNNTIKSVITGILVGFIGTAFGSSLWILLFSDMDIPTTIKTAYQQKLLAAILSAGALVNIASFFLFVKQNKTPQAKGVIIATMCIAFYVIYQKLS